MRKLAVLTGIPNTTLQRAGIPLDLLARPPDAVVVARCWYARHGDPQSIRVALRAATPCLRYTSWLITVSGQHLVFARASDATGVLDLATGIVVASPVGRWWWEAASSG